MSYTKQNFEKGQILTAENLNNIENGIVANEIAIAEKQPKGSYLTEHQKIKTINGQSLVGTGNISITGGTSGASVSPLKDGEYNVLAVNHRGYSLEAPENTIPAYVLSKKKGFNFVECDVSFTSDGVPVLLHDSTIDRTSNGAGKISMLTYNQLLQYDFGSWFSEDYAGTLIPTFKQFITCCKCLGLHPYIELKSGDSYTSEQIKRIVDEVEMCGMRGKVTYISFNKDYLTYVKDYDTEARLGFLDSDIKSSSISKALALKTGCNEVFLDVIYSCVTEAKVALCASNNLPLEVWTVDTESEIEALHPYISGVTSNCLSAGKVLYDKYLSYVTTPDENPGGNTGGDNGGDDSGDSGGDVGGDTGGDDSGETVRYTITNNLTNATTSNSSVSIEKDDSYIANISASAGYTISNVVVTMGGEDVTESVYANGSIFIESVTGDIVITVVSVSNSYELVRTITQDELTVGVQLINGLSTGGTMKYSETNAKRTSYVNFDLETEPNYMYKFDFVTGDTSLDYSIGTQWYTQADKTNMENKQIMNNIYDPGWLTNGVEHTPPASNKNSPIVGVRFTFKRNNNTNMQPGDIVSVTISRKRL